MKTIAKTHIVYSLAPDHPPAGRIIPGEDVLFETCDCFSDTITSKDQLLMELDFDRVNPATGPLYIEGAEPGDVLEITIEQINLADQAIMLVAQGAGFLPELVEQPETRIFKLKQDKFELFGLELELTKMIGVIGTAPADGSISTGTPGEHGGNMDCTLIKQGATLYLPVAVKGALLALGDLHAVMGDGEISVSGGEAAGEVHLNVNVLKASDMPTPSVLTAECFATIYSAETMELAGQGAAQKMIDYLIKQTSLTKNEAYMLLSAAGKLAICQVVDPLVTLRMELPRAIYDQLFGRRNIA